jgi:hypothetical protein
LAAAQRGIWKASDLQRTLADYGLVISAGSCQARMDAKAVARSPARASYLAPHLPRVRNHQIFFDPHHPDPHRPSHLGTDSAAAT